MMNLALWLKRNDFRADQVQTFYPSPMASATAMYHSGHNTLKPLRRSNDTMPTVKGLRQRRLHKAFLRYHDPDNWPMLRKALAKLGRRDLIGSGPNQLIPRQQPRGRSEERQGRPFATQHNGLPKNPRKPGRRRRR